MIRGADFYQYCFQEISRHPQIEIIYAEIGGCSTDEKSTTLVLNQAQFQLPRQSYLMQSIVRVHPG